MAKKYDVLIAGAGITGLFLARSLREKGIEVGLIDRKKKENIGKKTCSGIVSQRIKQFLTEKELDKVLLSELTGIEFYFNPKQEFKPSFDLEKETLVLDRELLDNIIFRKVLNQGADFYGDYYVTEEEIEINDSVKLDKLGLEAEMLVDATGIGSLMERKLKGEKDQSIFTSSIIRLPEEKIKESLNKGVKRGIERNKSVVIFDDSYSDKFFSWILPRTEQDELEFGTIAKSNSQENLADLLRRLNVSFDSNEIRNHPIKIGLSGSCSKRFIAVGESAGQVKPLTGGGIIYGMIGAEVASEAIEKSLEKENFSTEFFKNNYEKKWRNKLKEAIETQLELIKAIKVMDFDQIDQTLIKSELDPEIIELDYDFLPE